jgi:sulfoxide reductase heme-binding subunit YedZ
VTALGGLERAPRGFGAAVIVLAALPAAWIVYALAHDVNILINDPAGTTLLGTDPVKEGEHLLGSWTLRFLLLTLAVTPVRRITHWNWLAKHRRTLGLFAFGYGVLHLLTWALLDVQIGISEYVGWADIRTDILKRPFITIGMTCLLLMVPLAVTSTKGMIRRLGKRWGQLHKLVYVVACLAIVHYWMAVKLDITGPAIYGAILALLLGWRWREARAKAAPRAATP